MIFYLSLILCALPSLIPLVKFLRKEEINMFDFLQLFSAVFFLYIPLLKAPEYTEGGVWSYLVVYLLFAVPLWATQSWYTHARTSSGSVLNVTHFLGQIYALELSRWAQGLIALILFLVLTIYLPQQALVLRTEAIRSVKTYEASIIYQILGSAFFLVGIVLSLVFVGDRINKRHDLINIVLFGVFGLCALLSVRRDLIYSIIALSIIAYGFRKSIFNLRFLLIAGGVLLFVITIYFPFYNIIRTNQIKFRADAPIESITQIVESGLESYDRKVSKASSRDQRRSMNLYNALYELSNKEFEPWRGELTWLSIDNAIPRFLNPGKGNGVGNLLEKASGNRGRDIADSVILLGVGEFGFLGGVYAYAFFLMMFLLYAAYAKFYGYVFKSKIIPVYILFVLLSYCWNQEILLVPFFSWFFSSLPTIIVLLILEKTNALRVVMKRDVVATEHHV